MTETLLALARVFAVLSLTSFGGGNVTLPEIQRQAVAVHGWLTEREFLEAFSLSRGAPGPSTLFVLLVGWRTAGGAGALVATAAMFLPGASLMFAACSALGRWNGPVLRRVLAALKPVTIGLLVAAVWVLGRSAVADGFTFGVAAVSAALALTRAPLATLLAGAIAAGLLFG